MKADVASKRGMKSRRAPMRRKLIDMLESAIAAELSAAELRKLHGSDAEMACDALIDNRGGDDPQIEHLKDVRRALRWT
jgi:hypothetical protein